MKEEAQTWHYGLVAQYWAEHNIGGPEIAYFQNMLEVYGDPALDAGCGTGRLLVPFLEAGLDVDGVDVSQDMLSLCRKKAEAKELSPQLYRQTLHELNLPRSYQTIVACGVLGIGVSRDNDFFALQRFYDHLVPGGTLLLEHYLPYGNAKAWQLWLKPVRDHLPEPWPDGVGKTAPEDGSGFEMHGRVLAFDPFEQQITRQIHIALWRDGGRIAEEEYTLSENFYFRNELQQMIERAGFKIEGVKHAYSDDEASPEDDVIVFIARK